MTVVTKVLSKQGIWRVGRAPDPLTVPQPLTLQELGNSNLGNRFDSPTGTYKVLYFATSLGGCFGETLARFRPDLNIRTKIEKEWEELGFMKPGHVPRDWRQRRVAVRIGCSKQEEASQFVDVEHLQTRELRRSELTQILTTYDCEDFDVATVRGGDRRVTRQISQWVYDQVSPKTGDPLYAGIRYLSRLNSEWECWAIFDRTAIEILEQKPILPQNEELEEVAKTYKIVIH